MPHFDKHFTLAEANGLIPLMRDIFTEIHALIQDAREAQTQNQTVETVTPGRTNGSHKKIESHPQTILAKINELITEITDRGIVIQDVARGLIDFPAFVHGEEVFLCYELADGDKIHYYHPLDTGYAGRTPIPKDMT